MLTRRSGSRRSSPRRKLVWARAWSGADISIAQNATAQIDLLSQFQALLGADLVGCTIMRIRGTVALQNTTAGLGLHAGFGIMVGPADLTAAQTDPDAHPGDDWMYWRRFLANQAVAGEFARVDNFDFDVRAKRKLDEVALNLWGGFTNKNNAAGNIAISWATSTLIALP